MPKFFEGKISGTDAVVMVNGAPLDLALDVQNHSPSGFSWGYGGSGPAQLALALLVEIYGRDAPEVRYYQDFKWRIVAAMPQEKPWWMSEEGIRGTMKALINEVETKQGVSA